MKGIQAIVAERVRQINVEKYSPEGDQVHESGQLAGAAAAYALKAAGFVDPHVIYAMRSGSDAKVMVWPFGPNYWKPSEDPIRNLEKAGALIAAEIDRLKKMQEFDESTKEQCMEAPERWSISRNNVDFSDDCLPSRQAAIEEGLATYPDEEFYIGRCVPPTSPEIYWHADDFLEHAAVQDDYMHDAAEDFGNANSEQTRELEDIVRPIMADWLKRHGLEPNHFCIVDDEKIDPADYPQPE